MNFSDLFKQNGHLCRFSPNGSFLANVAQYRLVVRDIKTLQIVQLYTCLDAIQQIEWSSDSRFILCGMYKRGMVQVWSLEQPEWTCKIDEGSAGLKAVRWSPDGRHILTTADFHLRITVWSLVNKSVSYIKYPKDCKQGIHFTKDGKYMALAERRDCRDYVSVFVCNTWQLVKHFATETQDLSGLEWSPDGSVLCVWDSLLEVRILNHITWKTVVEHSHPHVMENPAVVVYKEVEQRAQVHQQLIPGYHGNLPVFAAQSKYDVLEACPIEVPVLKPDPDKANPKIGISLLAFSSDNKYLATKNDNMPNALWIWDVQKLCQTVLMLQVGNVKCAKWSPVQTQLALCTGNNKLYLWSPAGSVSVEVPTEASFQVHKIQWHPEGGVLLLSGKEQMCLCFLEDNR
ncbi:putative WD repeat-containing protein WRAP73 [Apostichopus japonicus]|uniref:Putative WD repeat-containing protein WRAP73 n=1 Tax=Stichopus japonicus TaxID=307972 RepID=A0A2G8LDW3_STIJA|nr:putative WD repeat-containing protein WRAP73 [Apostichopus japonicus]